MHNRLLRHDGLALGRAEALSVLRTVVAFFAKLTVHVAVTTIVRQSAARQTAAGLAVLRNIGAIITFFAGIRVDMAIATMQAEHTFGRATAVDCVGVGRAIVTSIVSRGSGREMNHGLSASPKVTPL